jgi:hypothetical protein
MAATLQGPTAVVTDTGQVLLLLLAGHPVTQIATATTWPPEAIIRLAARNGLALHDGQVTGPAPGRAEQAADAHARAQHLAERQIHTAAQALQAARELAAALPTYTSTGTGGLATAIAGGSAGGH